MLIVNLSYDASKSNTYLSNTLLLQIKNCISEKKKVILYLNKRGQYNSLICENCSHIFKCKNCDVSLSVHNSYLLCHICSYKEDKKLKCPECHSQKLRNVGVGTQQIEDNLKNLFPSTKIARLDTDMFSSKSSKKEALSTFKNSDIVIGTKMITTGFDFQNIGLIGIILLEQELQIPSYKTEEQLFSNLKQLIGRGGRRGEKTQILIQTYVPDHNFITQISESNTRDFLLHTLQERKDFSYPPFSEFLTLEYRSEKQEIAFKNAKNLLEKLNNIPQNEGNIEIIFNNTSFRKHNKYHYKIILKGKKLREFLSPLKETIFKDKNLSIIFD